MTTNPKTERTCVACGEPILKSAFKCKTCGESQTWFRHLNFGHSILSLWIALISVTGLSLPVIISSFRGEYSAIRLSNIASSGDKFWFVVENTGTRPGVLAEYYFSTLEKSGSKIYFSESFMEPQVIQPGELKAFISRFPRFGQYVEQKGTVKATLDYSEITFGQFRKRHSEQKEWNDDTDPSSAVNRNSR